MAHLKTLDTKDDVNERQRWKLSLAKRLYQRGYDRQSVINLLRFIDWLVYFPEGVGAGFLEFANDLSGGAEDAVCDEH